MSDKFNEFKLNITYGRVPSRRTILAAEENDKLKKHHINYVNGSWGVWVARNSKEAGPEELRKAMDFVDRLNND
jgi:hypothetical protein